MAENKPDIAERTFAFAVRIVTLCKALKRAGVFSDIVRQLLKSGTSVGANVAEAQSSQSRADFVSRMSVALKEGRETLFWLRLVGATESTFSARLGSVINEAEEIVRILVAIIGSAKRNGRNNGVTE